MKTFIRLSLIISTILFQNFNETYAQEFLWAKGITSTLHNVSGNSIAHDKEGNIYVTGNFPGTAVFDTIHLTSFGPTDVFIAKYDPNGNCVWANHAGGASDARGTSISVDAEGNSYVAGDFRIGTIRFDTIQISSYTNNGFYDIFIAKYDPQGKCIWAQRAGGDDDEHAAGIISDNDDNCYVTGYFTGPANFGTDSLLSLGDHDIFIAKYDKNGNCLWVKQAGHWLYGGFGNGIALNGGDNIYITGYFYGTLTFDTINITSYGGYDIFIAKYDLKGNCQWVKHGGGKGYDYGRGISTDKDGNIYITGYFNGSATIGNTQFNGNGNDIYSTFLVKYAPDGYCLWAKQAGYTSDDCGGWSIATDSIGNSYITGSFWASTVFDTIQLTGFGATDIFMAKYSPDGFCQWAKNTGGKQQEIGYGITIDTKGNCYATGTFARTALFGTIQLSDSGAFITKIGNPIDATKNEISPISNNFSLQQNYPNPFNPSTNIEFKLPHSSFITLKIYNFLGQEMETIAGGYYNKGNYLINWNAKNYTSGVYFYVLNYGGIRYCKEMVLIK